MAALAAGVSLLTDYLECDRLEEILDALDVGGVVLCVAAMSISGLFYIIGGQWLVSKLWALVPISGYAPGLDAARFLMLLTVPSGKSFFGWGTGRVYGL